ncbi:hypothetical protein [Chryseobacterium sp. CCH4-E10]|uniref:hypothetical protein n=1 Tax=Chryseobacterium sp. CCH4-E10 TaxID=1768758 RepID=UPI0012F91137|nr:hypothetical protein [Chryseobacterium sp. CCH4-E10]
MVGLKSENFSKLLIHEGMRNAFMIIYKLKGGFNRNELVNNRNKQNNPDLKYIHRNTDTHSEITEMLKNSHWKTLLK